MGLVVVGINHNTAPLRVREKISLTKRQLNEALLELKKIPLVLGIAILSTCNRLEIYMHLDENDKRERIIRFLLEQHMLSEDDFNSYFYILEEEDCAKHIFKVASGLDSQVLGETQILGQVKSALTTAKDLGVSGEILETLFEKAIYIGKLVRSETGISQGNVSIGSVAIRMLEEKFIDLPDKLILIIGAGKIGALISKYLKERGIKGIFVSNRTHEKACELALYCEGEAINFSRLGEKLMAIDIVVSSTASPHLILKKETLLEVMKTRIKPLLIMDLALPRDVDPEARNIPSVSLYDLDDLKSVVEENFARRRQEAEFAEMIIQRELNKFLDSKGKILCRQKRPLESVPDPAL